MAADRHGEPGRRAVDEQTIAVDPALVDERHIVGDDEAVGRVQQLIITYVGKQIRLHDRELHATDMRTRFAAEMETVRA
jgi:hypothetical protein